MVTKTSSNHFPIQNLRVGASAARYNIHKAQLQERLSLINTIRSAWSPLITLRWKI